jgi:hypothetical protein
MDLLARDGSVEATNGIMLGSGVIANGAPWKGEWTNLKPSKKGCEVRVAAASAVVVKISR